MEQRPRKRGDRPDGCRLRDEAPAVCRQVLAGRQALRWLEDAGRASGEG